MFDTGSTKAKTEQLRPIGLPTEFPIGLPAELLNVRPAFQRLETF
ncbi:hypothetical protein [Alkalinema sp. FACHB-956]|nr:hypothetical protein [Alkalinema sp. FACHB-956]